MIVNHTVPNNEAILRRTLRIAYRVHIPKDYLGNRSKSVRQLVWIGNKHVMIVNADGGTKWNIYTYDLSD